MSALFAPPERGRETVERRAIQEDERHADRNPVRVQRLRADRTLEHARRRQKSFRTAPMIVVLASSSLLETPWTRQVRLAFFRVRISAAAARTARICASAVAAA